MRIPRWSLLAAATVLALPVAGPAFATAAGDEDVTFLSALAASFSSDESCEDEGEPDPDAEEDPEVFAELSDTVEEGVDPCADEHGDDGAGGDGDPDEPADDETDEETLEEEDAPSEDPDNEPAPEDGQLSHGALVSTVARCAPRGPEARELFEQRNHGAFVAAAAQGRELEVLGETFDLSSPEGVEALCDFVAEPPEQEDEEPDTSEETDAEVESQQSAHARPGNAERPANPGQGNGKAADKAGSTAPPGSNGGGNADKQAGNGDSKPAHAGQGKPAHAGKGRGGPDR